LNKEEKRIPISSVVLSSQRIDLKNALYNAATEKDRNKDEAVNPLVQNRQKLIPSVTRVFRKSHEMYVYLQAYEQGAASVQPLVAFVSFYCAQTKVFETQPKEVADVWNNRVKTVPISISLVNVRGSTRFDGLSPQPVSTRRRGQRGSKRSRLRR
jgi:hypothetical protein